MTRSDRVFPDGSLVPGTSKDLLTLVGGHTATLTTQAQIIELPTESGKPSVVYDFLFWDVNAQITPASASPENPNQPEKVSFPVPSDEDAFQATAWYLATGGNGPGPLNVQTYAFSQNKDSQISNTTPIQSVTPNPGNNAWSGQPSTTVSTTASPDPVQITALNKIVPNGVFSLWLSFVAPEPTVSKNVLTVQAKASGTAIAFYGIPVPDPCQSIRNQISNTHPGDFPTAAEYGKALEILGKELLVCEEINGESTTTS